MGLEVKKSEYAKLRGVAPSYITKLLGKGLLVLSADGKRVDVEASNARIEANAQVDRDGVRDHHARTRLLAELDPRSTRASSEEATYPLNSAAAPTGGPGRAAWDGAAPPPRQQPYQQRTKDADAFNEARAKKEGELARLAELERMEREGALVSTDSVRIAAGRVAAVIVQGLDQLAPRLSDKLAKETDERRCALLIDEGVRQIREDLAREVLRITGEGSDGAA